MPLPYAPVCCTAAVPYSSSIDFTLMKYPEPFALMLSPSRRTFAIVAFSGSAAPVHCAEQLEVGGVASTSTLSRSIIVEE